MNTIRISKPAGFNVYRKIWHVNGLVIPICYYLDAFDAPGRWFGISGRMLLFWLVFAFTAFLLILDFARFRWKSVNDLFFRVVGVMLKKDEKAKIINATIPFFFANVILIFFFSREIALLSCIFLMVGDPTAAFIGGSLGRVRFKNGKSLEGMAAFFLSGCLGSFLFLLIHTLSIPSHNDFSLYFADGRWNIELFFIVAAGGLAGAVSEFFSHTLWMGFLDDNLIVPLSCALTLSAGAVISGVRFGAVLINPFPGVF